jgi:hypothetical protein
VAKIGLKLKKNQTLTFQSIRYNVNYLQNTEYLKKFCTTINITFQVLQELYEEKQVDTERKWQDVNNVYTETCQDVLRKKTTQRNEWITPRTLQKVEERKQKKEELNNTKTRQRKVTIQ